MRGGDSLRRDVLRMAANAAYNVEKRNQQPLTDDEFLAVLTKEVKAIERPEVVGNAWVGKTLSLDAGRWNTQADSKFTQRPE